MQQLKIGFISTRLAGTDGVSLETKKWVHVLERMGHECFFSGGELETPAERSFLVPEMHFRHPEIGSIYRHCFWNQKRERMFTRKIHSMKELLKDRLQEFVERFDLDLIILENCLAIPLNIPIGLAITEYLIENNLPAIAHHHDFFWERKRFLTNAIWDYLNMAFPPHIPNLEHVVINSSADNQISLRTGISASVIPNVMDFETPPPGSDDYTASVRDDLGIRNGEKFILQPTRVVQRKRIEHAIELVHRLEMPARLVVSHASGDEGYEYEDRVREYAHMMNVKVNFVSQLIGDQRGVTEEGRKIYTIEDIYPHADLVTYPSNFEGFGNAFLEAIYFQKPIVVNNYSVYATDIKPRGFQTIEFDGFITNDVVRRASEILENPEQCKRMVETNTRLARKFFSYSFLEQELKTILYKRFGCS